MTKSRQELINEVVELIVDRDRAINSDEPIPEDTLFAEMIVLRIEPSIEAKYAGVVEAMEGLMNSIGSGKKFCGHDFTCVCAWDKASEILTKHREGSCGS